MRDRRPPRGQIGLGVVIGIAGQLEDAMRLVEQRRQPRGSPGLAKVGGISRAIERQHRLQAPTADDRRFRRHLVGAVGQRRDQGQQGRFGREQGGLVLEQRRRLAIDRLQREPNLVADRRHPGIGQRPQPMPGNANRQRERELGRGLIRGPVRQTAPFLARDYPLFNKSWAPKKATMPAAAPAATAAKTSNLVPEPDKPPFWLLPPGSTGT